MSGSLAYFRRRSLRGLTTALILNGMLASASPPAWWSSGAQPVIDPTATVENHGVANIGQAKWMAKNALEALRAVLPVTAAAVEADLVGPGKPISSWAAPAPEDREKQCAPLLLGQLKAIAAPFYKHLDLVAPQWVVSERAIYGILPATGIYPWTADLTDDSNQSVALIGQLKAVFSLDFAADRETGTAIDGLPDLWEYRYFGALNIADPNAKLSPDGLTNKEKSTLGLAPTGDDLTQAGQRIEYFYDGERLEGVNFYTQQESSYGLDGNGNIESTTSN